MIARTRRLEDWYRRFGPLIYTRCRRLLRDDAQAEDATQEIFMRFMRCDQLPDEESAARWIASVTRNHCLNELRDRKLQPQPAGELPERGGGDLEGELDRRRFATQLFQRVPHVVREPAALRFLHGASQAEVARRLGVSLRTISTRMTTFTANCRAMLAARSGELARV